jgi:hypothetical protein
VTCVLLVRPDPAPHAFSEHLESSLNISSLE